MASSEATIRALARAYGLDERAVIAVALGEGGLRNRSGDVGDLSGGGSYGPFQLYTQGALPSRFRGRPGAADRWAWSPAGIEYAIRQMAQYAKGKRGRAAVEAIIRRFERPANPDASVEAALARLGGISRGGGALPAEAGGGGGGSPLLTALTIAQGSPRIPAPPLTLPDPRETLRSLSTAYPESPVAYSAPPAGLTPSGATTDDLFEQLRALRRSLLA